MGNRLPVSYEFDLLNGGVAAFVFHTETEAALRKAIAGLAPEPAGSGH
jgi:hypothetical protein